MRIAFLCGLFLLAPTLAGAQEKTKEKAKDTTVYEIAGKTLEQWIKEIPSKDRSKGENAIRTVTLFPADRAYQAIPVMTAELKKHTPDTPVDISIRVNIMIASGVILENVTGSDPKVLQDTIKQITRFLKDEQAIVRYRAIEALGRIGPEAKSAIPELVRILGKDKSTWETRQAAATSLGQVAYDPKAGAPFEILKALFDALGDPASQVKLAAIQSLTFLGGPGDPKVRQSLVGALEPLALKDTDPTVQIWANMAIMSVTDNISTERLSPIYKMLKHPELQVKIQAMQAIGTVGGRAKGVAPQLIANLSDPEPTIKGWSIWTLGKIGPFAADSLPQLQKMASDEKETEAIRNAAKDAVAEISGKKKQ